MALMSRGIVCAYPLLRGTNFFDQEWLQAGFCEAGVKVCADQLCDPDVRPNGVRGVDEEEGAEEEEVYEEIVVEEEEEEEEVYEEIVVVEEEEEEEDGDNDAVIEDGDDDDDNEMMGLLK